MINDIKKYISKGYIGFHTPAHKGRNKYINRILKSEYDLTELEETDNLFYADGCIKKLETSLAKVFGVKSFFLLVNGATSGVMAAVNLFKKNEKILIDRNCHISVLNGLIISGAKPVFIETELDDSGIPKPPCVSQIKRAYEKNKDAKALIITSPNYYGMFADVKAISAFCKENNIISIADEAHGTHFYYMNNRETAGKCGFDICILSFHKNLPSLTQTGGIIINNDDLKDKLKENLRAFTSTSPSYLFMLSVDAMNEYMEAEGRKKLEEIYIYSGKVKNGLANKGIKLICSNDALKVVVNCKNADKRAEDIKRKYKIVCEMCDSSNITYIISLHSYKKEIDLLKKALIEFCAEPDSLNEIFNLPEMVMTPKEAVSFETQNVDVKNAVGRICAEYVIDFPPSVPIIVPGEKIDEKILAKLKSKKEIICVRK